MKCTVTEWSLSDKGLVLVLKPHTRLGLLPAHEGPDGSVLDLPDTQIRHLLSEVLGELPHLS